MSADDLRQRIAAALIARIKLAVVREPRPLSFGSGAVTSILAANEYDLADVVLPIVADMLREQADAIDRTTQEARDDGVLERWQFRPCRDAAADLRTYANTIHPENPMPPADRSHWPEKPKKPETEDEDDEK